MVLLCCASAELPNAEMKAAASQMPIFFMVMSPCVESDFSLYGSCHVWIMPLSRDDMGKAGSYNTTAGKIFEDLLRGMV
jgi:hypothetical protein